MLKLFDNKSHSRCEAFQSANSVDVFATAIWDTVFPVLEWGMKIT